MWPTLYAIHIHEYFPSLELSLLYELSVNTVFNPFGKPPSGWCITPIAHRCTREKLQKNAMVNITKVCMCDSHNATPPSHPIILWMPNAVITLWDSPRILRTILGCPFGFPQAILGCPFIIELSWILESMLGQGLGGCDIPGQGYSATTNILGLGIEIFYILWLGL